MAACGIKDKDGQQAQNQLDHLARYGLVLQDRNEGIVPDGSRHVYNKEPHVRAHRPKIVRYADNPALEKKAATKRNPAGNGKIVIIRQTVTRAALKRKHVDVLYLMANPLKRHSLRVDAEIKAVNAEVRHQISATARPSGRAGELRHRLMALARVLLDAGCRRWRWAAADESVLISGAWATLK